MASSGIPYTPPNRDDLPWIEEALEGTVRDLNRILPIRVLAPETLRVVEPPQDADQRRTVTYLELVPVAKF